MELYTACIMYSNKTYTHGILNQILTQVVIETVDERYKCSYFLL